MWAMRGFVGTTVSSTRRRHARGPVAEIIADLLHRLLRRRLAPLDRYQAVHDIRVVGAHAAIEFVREGGGPDADPVDRLQRRCLDEHLLVYAGGWHGNALILVPPLIIDEADLDAALDRIVAIVADDCESRPKLGKS